MSGSVSIRRLEQDLLEFLRPAYPEIEVRVEPWAEDPSRLAVYFTEARFALLYPSQRYHYLRNLIPADYYDRHLADTEWFELAPGEDPDSLEYPDADLIDDITPDVLRVLSGAGFFPALDDVLCPADPSHPRPECQGDYRHARAALEARGFSRDELFDIFHVLMARGGYCDCEILLNAAEQSRLKAEYWRSRAEAKEPLAPSTSPPDPPGR